MLEFSCRFTCEVAKKRGWMRGNVWKVVRGFVARRVTSQAFERGRRRVKLFIRKKTMRREVREVQEYKKHASSGCQRWWAHTIKINTVRAMDYVLHGHYAGTIVKMEMLRGRNSQPRGRPFVSSRQCLCQRAEQSFLTYQVPSFACRAWHGESPPAMSTCTSEPNWKSSLH